MKFWRRVQAFNARCDVAKGQFLSLKWTTLQMVDHINSNLLPEEGHWRADFATAMDNLLRTKEVEEWKFSDIRMLLKQVQK